MKQFKQELNSVHLSEEQRQRIMKKVQQGHVTAPSHWPYRIVLSSFVALAIFFILLSMELPQLTTANHAFSYLETTHDKHFRKLLLLASISLLLVLTASIMAIRLLYVTERWQTKPVVRKAKQILRAYRQMWAWHMLTPIIWGILLIIWWNTIDRASYPIFNTLLLLPVYVWLSTSYLLLIHLRIANATWKDALRWHSYVTLYITIVFLLFVPSLFIADTQAWFWHVLYILTILHITFLLFAYSNRKTKQPSCPHCQHVLTAKEGRKIYFATLNKQCPHCQQPVYITQKSRQSTSIVWLFPLQSLFLANFFHVSWILVVLAFISSAYYFYFYVLTLQVELSAEKEDDTIKPLW
ncbi:hypothetical protein [Lysinibacillus piscis]|uniref:Uncharacterized protein n=1 Tax=Lysinibacillus piscis TaxID=2518931 RepID=A0ABQ5NK97_9BACI|nr:hypothetical protein [Lysinibacillus sp. KH24]GLC88533.1 hypothetical protein LYSBPC_16600 [Lysinibacillus sp. KH24]